MYCDVSDGVGEIHPLCLPCDHPAGALLAAPSATLACVTRFITQTGPLSNAILYIDTMKSRYIAVVGILLAVGAIIRYMSLLIPGPIVSNLVIAFYSLAIILALPTLREALGIGIVAGIICALLSHSIFPPANLISEPIGAVVCLGAYLALKDRIVFAPAVTTLLATLASGFTFILVALLAVAPTVLGTFGTVSAFLAVTVPIVLITAAVNAVVSQVLEVPASRALMRSTRQTVPTRSVNQVDEP
ncbi:hypothetical protein SAMN04488571_104241 [Methanoculleus thermophilus]|jgi:hypothetical protein|uniref:Uncharacterized protein n=2 Tax=Methanomicrobiaceae TaxID=2194 RepID=A0A1G8ZKQ7_9EURY|nr:hypothetical protein SAMN04488571_104241 [Methanoculleus thermophilus]